MTQTEIVSVRISYFHCVSFASLYIQQLFIDGVLAGGKLQHCLPVPIVGNVNMLGDLGYRDFD
jgi:hypothetical protein